MFNKTVIRAIAKMKSHTKPGISRLSILELAALSFTLAVSFVSAFWLWRFVNDYPDPSGANGYFYMKQTETLATGLGFYFKDYSIAFAIPVAFMRIIGNSLDAFRASCVFVWMVLVWGVGWLTFQLSQGLPPRQRLVSVMATVVAAACCTQLYEFTLTFFKNAFATTLVLWGAGFALGASPLWAVAFFSAALLAHKSVFVIVLILLFARAFQIRDRKQWGLLFGLAALSAVLFFCFFPKVYQHAHAMLGDFRGPQVWWVWLRRLPHSNFELFLTILGLFLIALVGILTRHRFGRDQRVYVDAIVVLICLALQPFQLPGPNGPFYRFVLLAPALSLPLLVCGMGRIRYGVAVGIFLLIPFLTQPFLSSHEIDEVFTPWAVTRKDVLEIKNYVNPKDHLTSHHGLEFFIDYTTGIRSRSFLSDHSEMRDFRVAYVPTRWIRNAEASAELRDRSLMQIGSEYLLMTESTWQDMRAKWAIRPHWKNPESHRPDFISE